MVKRKFCMPFRKAVLILLPDVNVLRAMAHGVSGIG